MDDQYILSLDIGTTRVTATLFDHDCNSTFSASKKITQYSPKVGWYEQDPDELWENIMACITNILIISKVKPNQIVSMGISNQRETTILWDKRTGKPVHNALVWESRQTESIAKQLINDGNSEYIHQRTGLRIDPYFSATKILWLFKHVENTHKRAEQGDLLFGTIDTWIVWKLTNGAVHSTDYTNACRTMLFNIHTLDWDDEILDMLAIPRKILPEIKSNSEVYGQTDPSVFFNTKIPIACSIGDQQAALVGQLATSPGDVAGTYGTGAFIIMNTGKQLQLSDHDLLTTISYSIDGKITYALEGSIFVAGSAIEWLKKGMQLVDTIDEVETLSKKSTDHRKMYVVPAFTGLSAPYWDTNATGASFGMTEETTKFDFIRATLESIAYQTTDILNYMKKETHLDVHTLNVNGEVAKNNYLTQFQADISNRTLIRAQESNVDSRGVAFLAGMAVGFWDNFDEIRRRSKPGKQFTPSMPTEQRDKLYSGWQKALKATVAFAD